MKWATDYDCKILYKSEKKNVVADALSWIYINAFSLLLSSSTQNAIIKAYHKEFFKSLIKEVKKKKGTHT